jgi:hypothetical protein
MKRNIFIALLLFVVKVSSISSQNGIDSVQYERFLQLLDSIVEKQFYKNPKKDISILFSCRIDSTGEITNVHILDSKNFKLTHNSITTICSYLEYDYKAKFLYTFFSQRPAFKGGRYVYCGIPYRNKRKK